jgi:hypothetical protein
MATTKASVLMLPGMVQDRDVIGVRRPFVLHRSW